ncbi:general substrate transporter [Aspergillus sclerotioniger CBS 115572]|uniref:General substrate transporter n=1 Tax=Aspergillus sclerotioniger CBS 115572 TaxID=1450535 RepID=A0A317XAC3_9EURO|nr:general substrate transporter [Aspergillus sclerotioniger CBS 115572]PWY94517.1 general substrate transporter [Aspergillus sclerotioniger CBS 115572]
MTSATNIVGGSIAEALPVTDKYWSQQRHLLRLNLVLLIPLLSSSTFGYDGSLMNGLQSLRQWQEYFNNPRGSLLGTIIASQSIGSVIALPFLAHLCDQYGRKPILFAGLVIICIATGIQCASVNLPMFIVARILIGIGGMFSSQPSPMLIAELAYPTHRGKYTSAYWTMYYLGAILSSWCTFGTQALSGSLSWRIPSLLQAGYPLVQLIFLYWVPESPRWLVAQNRIQEATATLQKYHAGQEDPNAEPSPLVAVEIAEITHAIEIENSSQSTGWSTLVATPGNRKRTTIAICVGAFAQWNGIAVVSYFLTLVLDSIGITSPHTQTLLNGLLQLFNFAASLTAAFLVDRLGRRTLFLWSGIGMFISYIIWTVCSALTTETGSKPAGYIVIVCVFIVFFHYDIAWTPLLFGYPTEIFPYSLRSKGLAVEMMAVYGSLVISSFCNPIGIANLGWKYYIVFCVFLAGILGTVFFYFPETKGHSLEEIAVIFDGDSRRGMLDFGDEGGCLVDEGKRGGGEHVEVVE